MFRTAIESKYIRVHIKMKRNTHATQNVITLTGCRSMVTVVHT